MHIMLSFFMGGFLFTCEIHFVIPSNTYQAFPDFNSKFIIQSKNKLGIFFLCLKLEYVFINLRGSAICRS